MCLQPCRRAPTKSSNSATVHTSDLLHLLRSPFGRFCCKSLFALLIKNSLGCRRDFRVKMWGTSSRDDKLVSDLAKATEATKISARRSDRLMAGKLSPLNCGVLQQYLPKGDLSRCSNVASHTFTYSITSSAATCRVRGTVRPSALAALRLITSSNFVGCTTGRSLAFAPLRSSPA